MCPALLPLANDIPWPRVKSIPYRPQYLVQIGHYVRAGPPRRIPRNAVMLVNHQVEPGLVTIPLPGFENRHALATCTEDSYAINLFSRGAPGKRVRKPEHFMVPFH